MTPTDARPCAACAIQLADYINAADISASDAPHVVVEKLQKALDASCTHAPATGGTARETPKAWGDDVALRGPDAPKNNGHLKYLIEYLLTVYKRFGNTAITCDISLQWGATALHKRDEQKKRIEELERALSARQQGVCVPSYDVTSKMQEAGMEEARYQYGHGVTRASVCSIFHAMTAATPSDQPNAATQDAAALPGSAAAICSGSSAAAQRSGTQASGPAVAAPLSREEGLAERLNGAFNGVLNASSWESCRQRVLNDLGPLCREAIAAIRSADSRRVK